MITRRTNSLASRAGRSAYAAAVCEGLESRLFLSAAFDVTGLTALRGDNNYSGVDGSSIGVAILDTGLYTQHPDLAPNFTAWYDAVLRTSGNSPFDPHGHGSHVAGTAAARNPDVGVATQARLIGVRALPDENEPYPSHNPVLEALQWVIEHVQQYNIRVVNMSLGSPSNLNGTLPASQYQPLFAELERQGVTIVAASGNSYANYATPGVATPAAYATLNVANTWEDDGRGDRFGGVSGGSGDRYWAYEADAAADRFAATSQRGTLGNQVAAPGSTIYSTWNGDEGKFYNTISGTSMSSPLVAGAVALMQDAAYTYGGTYLSPAQIRNVIQSTADTIIDSNVSSNGRAELLVDSQGRPYFGPIQNLPETGLSFKRINIYRAVQQVRSIVTGTPGNPNPNPEPPPAGTDTNSTIPAAILLPSLDGTRSYTFQGNIGTDGSVNVGVNDVDLFKVVLESPGVVTFRTAAVQGGTSFDAYLRLFDSGGAQLAFSDDSGGTFYPTLTSVRLQPGTYYFGLTSYNNAAYNISTGTNAVNGQSQGDYDLTVSLANPDPNGVFQGAVATEAMPVMFGGYIGADLGQPVGSQDVDFFDIVAPDTGTLIIDIDTTAYPLNQRVDSYVRVFNENAEQIAFNDDETPQNLDSYLEIQVVRGQRLYIAIADYWNRNFNPADPFDRTSQGPGGLYDLHLNFRNGDTTGTIATALDATIGNTISAAIGNDGGSTIGLDGGKDVDFYRFTANAAGLLDITVASPDASLTAVVGLWQYNSGQNDATRLAISPVGAPRHIFRVSAGQTYYISVTGLGNGDFNWSSIASGSGGDTGSYTLTSVLRPLSELPGLSDNSVQGATPRAISLGQQLSDQIGRDGSLVQTSSDVDLFQFTSNFTGLIEIRTDSSGAGEAGGGVGLADTFLRLFNSSGAELAYNDDGYIGTVGSFLRVNVVSGQTYYIGVNGASAQARGYNPMTGNGAIAGATGAYVLSVDVATELHATTNGRIDGAVNGSGTSLNHHVTAVNADGQPLIFQQFAGGSWRAAELRAETGSPQITGPVVTWIDPKDGLAYAAAPSAVGVLLYTNAGGQWSYRNLTTEISGANVVVSEISAFVETNGIVNIAGLNSGGDLVLYTQNGQGGPASYSWNFRNLVQTDLAPQGFTMPQFAGGRFVSYVTGWNGLNVAGLTSDGQIYSVWWAPGLDKWQVTNLSASTGAPTLSGGLTVYLTPWGGINLAGLDQQGRVSVTWWVPGFEGEWRTNNLTNESSGPLLSADSLSSYVTSWGGLNITGLTGDGRIMVYWWVPGFERWEITSITDGIADVMQPVGRLTGVTGPGAQGTINVLGVAANGDVLRTWWQPGGNWVQEVLTDLAVPI